MWKADEMPVILIAMMVSQCIHIHFKCVQFLALQLCFTEFFFLKIGYPPQQCKWRKHSMIS